MLKFKLSAILVTLMMLAQPALADTIIKSEINVNSQAEVTPGETILLSDLAIVNNEELANIEIMQGLSEGESKRIANSEISKIIKTAISENENISLLKYSLFVPAQIMIKAKNNAVSASRIQNKIAIELKQKCGDCKVTFKDIKIPAVHEKISMNSCQLQTENLKTTASFLVPYICVSNNDQKTYWITGSVKLTKMAPVTQRQIAPGERILASDLKMQEVDVTFAKDGIPTIQEADGQIAARYLPIRQPVFKSDLKKEIAVTRGQLIRAISGNETFEVSSQVLSEEQGYIGDIIKIKNSETQKIMSGQIIEKGVVKVQ